MRPRRRRTDLKVIPGEGRRDIYYKQAAVYYLIMTLVLLLLFQAGYHWLGGMLRARRLQIVVAAPGYLEESRSLEGLILRNEEVITSPCSGFLMEVAPPGERVAVGETIATIYEAPREELSIYREQPKETLWEKISGYIYRKLGRGEEEESPPLPVYLIPTGAELQPERIVELTAERAGLLSTWIDGWEEREPFFYLDREGYDSAGGEIIRIGAGSYVEEGQPLLKVVDNWTWYYSTLFPVGEELAEREKAWLTFSFAPGVTIEATREEICPGPDSQRIGVTYRLEQQLEGFEENRWVEATAVYQRYEGVLVPARALCQEPETGLLVDEGGFVTFYPVELVKIQQEEALVEGLPPYSRVITRPERAKEGCRLN